MVIKNNHVVCRVEADVQIAGEQLVHLEEPLVDKGKLSSRNLQIAFFLKNCFVIKKPKFSKWTALN